jgi:hypothetical protein
MTIRFQADADFNHTILLAVIRREPAVDFQTSAAGGLLGLDDLSVLARAADQGRILVTHDQRTMPRHFAQFISQRDSAGLIVVRQSLSVAAAMEDLILIHAATESDEWTNRLVFLPL